MNTVYVGGDGEADERKSFIRTPNLHQHDNHIAQNAALFFHFYLFFY